MGNRRAWPLRNQREGLNGILSMSVALFYPFTLFKYIWKRSQFLVFCCYFIFGCETHIILFLTITSKSGSSEALRKVDTFDTGDRQTQFSR